MELIVKLAINDTSNIGMFPSAPKDVFIKFVYQCLHILTNTYHLNGLKGSPKIRKIEYQFKIDSHYYTIQRNGDTNHRCLG